MVGKLVIEWRHLEVEGGTCDRCYDTGENLAAEVKRLRRTLGEKGIEVEYIETRLGGTQITESNALLFNGTPIEDILNIKVTQNYCDSCSALLKTDTYCRTVSFEGNEYEEIPSKVIRQAAYAVLGLQTNSKEPGESRCCEGGGCC